MANLDTTSKRRSSVGLLSGWLLAPPKPDGTLDAGDRQHIALSYSGILAGAFVPPATELGGGHGSKRQRRRLQDVYKVVEEPLPLAMLMDDYAELLALRIL
jgi:hypothetical protein